MKRVITGLRKYRFQIYTVESCTGGALASAITDIPGSSFVLAESHITYSNLSKIRFGVPADTIDKYSVYSQETANAMAYAAWTNLSKPIDFISVGITGSLNQVDPANPKDSIPGEVYVAILVACYGTTNTHELKVQVPARLRRKAAKNFVVRAVTEKLLNILGVVKS